MIDVIDLKKNFHDLEVLKGINFKVEKGDIVAVIGPSGSGKSTFLRCLNCMEDPTSGKIIKFLFWSGYISVLISVFRASGRLLKRMLVFSYNVSLSSR